MDYQKMWEELRCGIGRIEQYIEPYHMPEGKSVLESIACEFKRIEQKYQPKQYSWSEIIQMNPLPKKIRSEINARIGYTLTTIFEAEPENTVIYLNTAFVHESPSINEMKNLWTIIE